MSITIIYTIVIIYTIRREHVRVVVEGAQLRKGLCGEDGSKSMEG
jgi:hypothetical protein